MGFFFCFYDNENNNRNMIEPEKYRKNDIFNDGVEDEYGDVNLNLAIPSEIYNHLLCMADDADMSVKEYIIQMATYGQIDDKEEDNYEIGK